MSIEIRFREDVVGIASLAVAVFGVLAAVLWSPWWGIVVPCGVVSAFRLVRDAARTRLAALKRAGTAVTWDTRSFFAVADGTIWEGALAPSHVAAFEARRVAPADVAEDTVSRRWRGTPPAWRRVPIHTIDRVESTTGEKTFRVIRPGAVEEYTFGAPHERDAALGMLREAVPWHVTETARSVVRFQPLSLVVGLPLLFFSAALVLAALGVVQPKQLPLMDWKRVGQVRGKGRAIAAAWATASQGFLWLLEKLPAAAAVALGILATAAFAALVYASQWTRIVDAVWTPTLARTPVGGAGVATPENGS